MKKSLTVIALLAGAASVYSQGQVVYTDYTTSFNIHIWSPDPPFPGVEQTGNSSVAYSAANEGGDAPVGTMSSYGGVLIGGTGNGSPTVGGGIPGTAASGYANGDNFTVELYAAAGDVVAGGFAGLAPVPSTAGFLADAAFGPNAASAGLFQQSTTVSIGTKGTSETFSIAAWFNNGGTITTLAGAQAALVPFGWSPLGTETLGGAGSSVFNLPGAGDSYTTDGGITSFSLVTPVPEPSTIALGVIGASAFLMRLRRKQ